MNMSTLPQTTSDIGIRLAVKNCELKKKDDALRRYKVATEQLCQFIEVMSIYFDEILCRKNAISSKLCCIAFI